MRHRLYFAVLLAIFFPSAYCQDLEYKFVVTDGEPVVLNASETVTVANFNECIRKCEADQDCILAYQANSTDPCYLFEWNSITQVTRNESGGVGTVAFKVYTNQPACDLNSDFLMNGKSYPLRPNDTTQYLWRIDTAEGGWTITYISNDNDIGGLVCGNWTFARPYADGCDSECNITMVQVHAKYGPRNLWGPLSAATVPSRQGANKTAATWDECMSKCYDDARCAVAYFNKEQRQCQMAFHGFFWFLERTTASEGHQMVIKLPMNEKTCKMSTEKLLDDQYYPVWPAMVYWKKRQYFRVQTTPKYYVFNSYADEDTSYYDFYNGCPLYNGFVSTIGNNFNGSNIRNETMCYRFDALSGVTQTDAKELCTLMNQNLMVDKYRGAMEAIELQRVYINVVHHYQELPFLDYEGFFGFPRGSSFKVWYGLEKDAADGKWKWADTRFLEFSEEVMPIAWAPGEPKEGAGLNCAYMAYGDGQPADTKYALYAAPCNSTDVDGFACSSRQYPFLGVKSYAQVAAEFGGEQPCALDHCPARGEEQYRYSVENYAQ